MLLIQWKWKEKYYTQIWKLGCYLLNLLLFKTCCMLFFVCMSSSKKDKKDHKCTIKVLHMTYAWYSKYSEAIWMKNRPKCVNLIFSHFKNSYNYLLFTDCSSSKLAYFLLFIYYLNCIYLFIFFLQFWHCVNKAT